MTTEIHDLAHRWQTGPPEPWAPIGPWDCPHCLLSSSVAFDALYAETMAPAKKVYDDARVSAWKVYGETIAPVEKAYVEARVPAETVYDEARMLAWKVYDEARARAFIQAWRDDCAKENA